MEEQTTQNKTMLEPSSNTHMLEGEIKSIKEIDNPVGTMLIETEGSGIVTHGEHGPLKTESSIFMKVNQQEYNPIHDDMRAAFD